MAERKHALHFLGVGTVVCGAMWYVYSKQEEDAAKKQLSLLKENKGDKKNEKKNSDNEVDGGIGIVSTGVENFE